MADTTNIESHLAAYEKNRERKDLPALSEALMSNKLDIAQALIERKANVNEYAKKPSPEYGLAPIHFAKSAQAVKMLADAGAKIDAPYKSDHAWGRPGETALQTLALTGRPKDMPTINALLLAGADSKREFAIEYPYDDSKVPAAERINRSEMSMSKRLDVIRENHTPTIAVQLLTKNRDDKGYTIISEGMDFQATMKQADRLQKLGVDIIVSEKDANAVVHAKSNLYNNPDVGRVIQPEVTPDGTYLKGKGEVLAVGFYDKLGVDYHTFADQQRAAREAAQQESVRTAENLKSQQREPDAPDEKNVVEEYKERELDVIDGKDAVTRAELLRQRERDHLALKQQGLGLDAESKRIDVQDLSAKAVRQDNANDLADRTGAPTDRPAQQLTEREKNRQIELMEQVQNQFRVAGSKYYFKDQPGKLALKDNGERMVTASNDDRVAKAMATMAEAKGWKTIKVSGHPDFQREVWMEANLRGIETRGFKPTEQDLKLLDAKRERAMHNSVEHDARAPRERPRQDAERKTDSARSERPALAASAERQDAPRKTDSARQEQPLAASNANDKTATAPTPENAPKKALRTHEGQVIAHGAAKFNYDPQEKESYFVKIKNAKGKEEIVWGVDLKRGMKNVKDGEHVKLEYRGNVPVTVEALIRDKDGKVTGKETIDTNRNEWNVAKSDKAKVAEAVAAAYIDSKIKDPAQREALKAAISERMAERDKVNKVPGVTMYDKSAPSKTQTPERTGPVIERNAERTR
jgi:hypothetical protein